MTSSVASIFRDFLTFFNLFFEKKSVFSKKYAINSNTIVDNFIMTMLIVFAMFEEAEPFVEQMCLQKLNGSPLPGLPAAVVWRGASPKGGIQMVVVWNGRDERYKVKYKFPVLQMILFVFSFIRHCFALQVNNVATTAAAVVSYAAVVSFRPALVISAGTAGGFAAQV